ncbi:MAG: zinc-binding dehydrogenase [Planctomycetes bacterium]|nr:zinc-binding dehydrogenase [Planctomycetota bacterium]
MKSIRFHQHGAPEVLKVEEVPDPSPRDGQVLLEIKAAGINHLDIWVRRGMPGLSIPLPRIPGADAAGVVREIGPGVDAVKVGQRVLLNPHTSCGVCEFCTGGDMSMCLRYAIWGEHVDGTYAERMVVPATSVIPIPDTLPFDQAAAAPLVFLTSWRMLMVRGRVRAGEDVLIHAAGAGVGTICVQLAKLAGARVIATASTDEKCGKAKALGADFAVNHAREDVVKRVREITGKRGVDVVVDYIGKETWGKSLLCLRRGGRLVTCGATSGYDPTEDLRHVFYRQIEIHGSTMGNNSDLSASLRCLFQGKVRPLIDAVLPLKDAAEAHRRIEARETFGKVVLLT